MSGTKPVEERGLEQLIRRVEEGASEGVMVYRIDCFGRDALEVLFAIRRLTGAKARLVSVGEGLDSSTDVGRLPRLDAPAGGALLPRASSRRISV